MSRMVSIFIYSHLYTSLYPKWLNVRLLYNHFDFSFYIEQIGLSLYGGTILPGCRQGKEEGLDAQSIMEVGVVYLSHDSHDTLKE